MKTLLSLFLSSLLWSSALADTKVMLPDGERFANNEKEFLVKTTIPGTFTTPEGITAALLTLADQAADKKVSTPFTPKMIASTSGGEGARDLSAYFRGAKLSGKTLTLSFSGEAMRYLNSTISIQEFVKGSLEGTLRLHFPKVKEIQYEVDGKIVKEWDA
jgi:hypothetical protein